MIEGIVTVNLDFFRGIILHGTFDMQSRVKIFQSGFGNGWLKSCAIVHFWGGQRDILRVNDGTKQEYFYTTLYLAWSLSTQILSWGVLHGIFDFT